MVPAKERKRCDVGSDQICSCVEFYSRKKFQLPQHSRAMLCAGNSSAFGERDFTPYPPPRAGPARARRRDRPRARAAGAVLCKIVPSLGTPSSIEASGPAARLRACAR